MSKPTKNLKKTIEKPSPISDKAFEKACNALNMTLDTKQSTELRHYLDTLMLWNTRINLVGTLTWQDTLNTLIIDSYFLNKFITQLSLPENPITWDLGSGAGLPGIPLRILWQKGMYHLVEAREKRALFMTNFLLKNPLFQVKVHWQRAEVFFAKEVEKNEKADLIVSRAFMPYKELTDFVSPYIAHKGYIILMLNEKITDFDSWKVAHTMEYHVQSEEGKQKRFFHALTKNIL